MTVTQLEWIKTKDALLSPNLKHLLKYIEKDLHKPVYMVETNFTMSCIIMPWSDDKIRLVSHIDLTDKELGISGTQTIRPMGIYN